MKKGQISTDFLAVSAVVLILALFLFQLYSQQAESTRIFATQVAAQRVAEGVARGINHAWLNGNGSVTHAQLPDSLPYGIPYNFTLRGRQAFVQYPAGAGSAVVSSGVVTSDIIAVNFTLIPGSGGKSLNITNSNGVIVVVG